MPYCTACGKQNPDDARFCAQCGTRLVAGERPPAPSPGESTATITSGRRTSVESSDRQLSPVDAAAVDALPAGHALLVVQRGPSAGSRFLLDTDVVGAGRHPDSEIFLDDVTVSRRHAEFRRTGDGVHRQRRGQPQRHLRQPRPHRLGRAQRRRRGPDRQVPPGVLLLARGQLIRDVPRRPPRPLGSRRPDEHRAGARPAAADFPGVTIPKIRFLEDKGLIKPERTPAGYRKFSADDVERLRYILRMQRDHYLPLQGDRRAPRRHRPWAGAAADRVRRAHGARRWRSPPTGCPSPESFAPHQRPAALAPRAAQGRRDLRGAAGRSSSSTACSARAPAPGTSTATRWSSPGPRASSPTSASSPATCARSRPPPTGRSASSSRSWPPWSAGSGRRCPGRAEETSARSRRCPCGCTPRSSRPGLSAALTRLHRSAVPFRPGSPGAQEYGGRHARSRRRSVSGSRCPSNQPDRAVARGGGQRYLPSGSVRWRRPPSPRPAGRRPPDPDTRLLGTS